MNTKSDDCFNPKRDHAYFQEIWEYKQPNGFQHSVELWDKRADVWAKELAHDGSFRQDVDDRVARVAAYLRGHGLLGPRSSVIDIGCGPGRFVVEFAKTAERAQGLDLSPRMAEIAGEYAQSVGVKNASFFFGDFKKMNVEEQGLKKQFDLVFTSITPAISTVESLRKLMEMSCGHCFNSCCIEWWDELEEKVAQQVFAQQNKPRPYWGRRWFYSLFNFLWLEGYFPEATYHNQESQVRVPIDLTLARHYTEMFCGQKDDVDGNVMRVLAFLKTLADADGMLLQRVRRRYGWLLWDVTDQVHV